MLNKRKVSRGKKNIKINNFFFIFIDQWYGFISNFMMFRKYKRNYPKKVNKFTNYNRIRLPDIVLMSDGSWKYHDYIFNIFLKLRIISIKSGSYFQNDINICYNILIGNSFILYKVLKNIFMYHKRLKKKKW